MEQAEGGLSSGTERHRMSMEDHESQLIDGLRGAVDQLNMLWAQVSMEQQMREARTQLIFEHMHDLLEEILTHEKSMVDSVGVDIKARQLAVDEYRRELSLAAFDVSIYHPGSIALLKALNKERDRMAAKRAEVLSHQIEVHTKLKNLHVRLGSGAPSFESVEQMILPAEARVELTRACEQAEQCLNDRLQAVQKLQANIKRLLERLGSEGVTEEELGLCEQDFSAVGVVVSENAAQRLEQLQGKLESDWTKWQSDAQSQFDQLRCRLERVYKKCSVPANERLPLDNFNTENDGAPGLLGIMERRADALEQRYERAKEVFDKLAEWHGLWQEKIAAEEVPIDYMSRDYTKRLRRMADLETLVPRAVKELCAVVQDHLRQHPDAGEADIAIGGLLVDRHAQDLLNQYNEEKERKRLAKARKKQPVGRKFVKPTDTDRNLHQIRRTPMKKSRKPAALNLDVSAIEAVRFNYTTTTAERASSPTSSIGLPALNATITPRKLRKFSARPSSKPASPTALRKPWK